MGVFFPRRSVSRDGVGAAERVKAAPHRPGADREVCGRAAAFRCSRGAAAPGWSFLAESDRQVLRPRDHRLKLIRENGRKSLTEAASQPVEIGAQAGGLTREAGRIQTRLWED
jgi:hypothetical protein